MQSNPRISLRQATENDNNAVYSFKKAAFTHYVKKQYGHWDEAEQRKYHTERFASNNIKIITVEQSAVGFVSVVSEFGCMKVHQLIIHPEHQGQGIGEQCMALIKHQASRKELPVRLQVMKVNPRAMKFYLRIGFVLVGETETHYQMEFKS